MSNILNIKVAVLKESSEVVVLANDAYASTYRLFEDEQHFKDTCRDETALVCMVLENPIFEHDAGVDGDWEHYELNPDLISGVVVTGFSFVTGAFS